MGFLRRRPELEEYVERIGDLYDDEDFAGARKALRRAKKHYPGSLDLEEWEASLCIVEERWAEALEVLDGILRVEPDRAFALRERASVLVDLGRFPEALRELQALLSAGHAADDPEERARLLYEIGLCLDREGREREADAEFRRASRLDPEGFPLPPRMSAAAFDAVVTDALDSIPEPFLPYLQQVTVVVQDYPGKEHEDPLLLGLYVGVPRTERSMEEQDHLDRIYVYKRNHELLNLPLEELRVEIRKTVIHEIAHHFGLAEEDMGEYA